MFSEAYEPVLGDSSARPAVAVRPDWPVLDGPVTFQEALDRTTRGRLRGNGYQRLLRGVYLASGTVPRLDHWVAAWRLALRDNAVWGGPTAAFVLGVPWFADGGQVELVQLPPLRIRSRPGLRVRGDILLPDEVDVTAFGLSTSLARTAYDLARRGSLPSAVASVDAVLRAGAADVRELRLLVDRYPGARNIRQARLAVELADPRAESMPESRLRVMVLEAGARLPTPQFDVIDRGVFVARLDLAIPRFRIGFEYDGAHHREPEQFSKDLRRHNRLRALDWTIIRIDAAQMQNPDALIHDLRRMVPAAFSPRPTAQSTAIAEFRAQKRDRRRR